MKSSAYLNILLQLSITLFTGNVFANITDWLKKAENKSNEHSIKNIDFIYVINLDQRPEKFQCTIKALEPYGIIPYRFSAVNGWEIPLEALNSLGVTYQSWMEPGMLGSSYPPEKNFERVDSEISQVGQNYFCRYMSRGAIGITLSHLSILKDAYDSGYERIWVMEDDIQVIKNPHLMSALIEELDSSVGKDQWDILFTDKDTKAQNGRNVICRSYAKRPNFTPQNPSACLINQVINRKFRRLGARYGTYSMIINRPGMEKLLNFFENYQIFLPFDMEYTLPPGIKFYTVLDDIVSTIPTAVSDNAVLNYTKTN